MKKFIIGFLIFIVLLSGCVIGFILYTSPGIYIKGALKTYIQENLIENPSKKTLSTNEQKLAENIKKDGLQISAMSDNEGAGPTYYYVCLVNGTKTGIFMKNEGDLLNPNWVITSVDFY